MDSAYDLPDVRMVHILFRRSTTSKRYEDDLWTRAIQQLSSKDRVMIDITGVDELGVLRDILAVAGRHQEASVQKQRQSERGNRDKDLHVQDIAILKFPNLMRPSITFRLIQVCWVVSNVIRASSLGTL